MAPETKSCTQSWMVEKTGHVKAGPKGWTSTKKAVTAKALNKTAASAKGGKSEPGQ